MREPGEFKEGHMRTAKEAAGWEEKGKETNNSVYFALTGSRKTSVDLQGWISKIK